MKTCPWNREGVLLDKAFTFAAINFPFARKWLAHMDDTFKRGVRNMKKQWWYEIGWVKGEVIKPDRINKRDLRLDHTMDPAKQRIAIFPRDLAPPPDAAHTVPVGDTMKEGIERNKTAERPEDYAKRLQSEGKATADTLH